MSIRLLVLVFLGSSSLAYAEGSPWLPADATTSVGVSITSGSTEDFFIGDTSTNLGGDLSGTFVWLSASYGYDDIWAFDARAGYAESEFDGNPDDQSDFADTSIGVSYQLINEFEADNGLPTVSARLGYTFGGDYETTQIDAIGEGASGFDLSLLVGKSLNAEFAIYSDLTVQQRDNGVPDSVKFLLSGSYASPIPQLGFQLGYAGIRSDSDLNFGDAAGEFSQVDKESDWLVASVNYGFDSGVGVGFSYSSILSGRNVPDSDIATFNIGYSF